MTMTEVFDLLQQNQNTKGMNMWQELPHHQGLTSYGIGLTVQRKLAKQIGKDRQLAQQLWASDNYDAKVISLLIDDPKKITVEQAQKQVEQLQAGLLCHVFCSCGAPLAKAPIALELAKLWVSSDDVMRRRSGYGLFYDLSKKKSKKLTDDDFLPVIDKIADTFEIECKDVQLAMGSALMGIGKRNQALNQAALPVAKRIGPIDFNQDGQTCDPFDVVKHLTSDYLKQKWATG